MNRWNGKGKNFRTFCLTSPKYVQFVMDGKCQGQSLNWCRYREASNTECMENGLGHKQILSGWGICLLVMHARRPGLCSSWHLWSSTFGRLQFFFPLFFFFFGVIWAWLPDALSPPLDQDKLRHLPGALAQHLWPQTLSRNWVLQFLHLYSSSASSWGATFSFFLSFLHSLGLSLLGVFLWKETGGNLGRGDQLVICPSLKVYRLSICPSPNILYLVNLYLLPFSHTLRSLHLKFAMAWWIWPWFCLRLHGYVSKESLTQPTSRSKFINTVL